MGWLLGNIPIGCHAQYRYCSDSFMVWQLPADDGRVTGE